MTGLLCQREDCPTERILRAFESIRQQQVAPGGKPAYGGETSTWMTCALCQKLKGWARGKEGLVRSLTTS